MPREVEGLRDEGPFPVKPQTDEYRVLSFLVQKWEYAFTPDEIVSETGIDKPVVLNILSHFLEKEMIEQTEDLYYLRSDQVDVLKRRLDSVDAAVRLFEAAPGDDAYAEEGWENSLPSIDTDQGDTEPEPSESDESEPRDISEEAAALIDRLSEERESEKRG